MATTRQTGTANSESYPLRGEIYLTSLDPAIGREIQKTRPALIVQNDVSNRLSDITIVSPITSTVRLPLNPVHVLLAADSSTGLSVVSVAMLNQVRAVDRQRLIKRLGAADAATMAQVDEAIKIAFGLRLL